MPTEVTPQVFLIARPSIDWNGVSAYLHLIGASTTWLDRIYNELNNKSISESEALVEFMGRLCYRSWEPGLNPNVTKVRENSVDYLRNILQSAHGSVLEHVNYSFVFANVSRVFTHELVRHRAGTAVSQESLRYVRLDDIPFEHPQFITNSPELLERANALIAEMEKFQVLMAEQLGLDARGVDFNYKKKVTSGMRRYAPDGLATTLGWTVNVRALRHVLAMRTDPHAEDEIRRVFAQVGLIMQKELPALLSDFKQVPVDGSVPAWIPEFKKV